MCRILAVREDLVLFADVAHVVRAPGVTTVCGRYVPDSRHYVGAGYTLYSGPVCTGCALAVIAEDRLTAPERLERVFGPEWQTMPVKARLDQLDQLVSGVEKRTAAVEAGMTFLDTLAARLDEGEPLGDALFARVVREVYGERPTPEQITSVLEVVENIHRMQRGQPPLEPGA